MPGLQAIFSVHLHDPHNISYRVGSRCKEEFTLTAVDIHLQRLDLHLERRGPPQSQSQNPLRWGILTAIRGQRKICRELVAVLC